VVTTFASVPIAFEWQNGHASGRSPGCSELVNGFIASRYQTEVTILARINATHTNRRPASNRRDDAREPAAACSDCSVGDARDRSDTQDLHRVGFQRRRCSSDPPKAGRDSGESESTIVSHRAAELSASLQSGAYWAGAVLQAHGED
jgi:hypothetical protein